MAHLFGLVRAAGPEPRRMNGTFIRVFTDEWHIHPAVGAWLPG
jgi:hypothetical protein